MTFRDYKVPKPKKFDLQKRLDESSDSSHCSSAVRTPKNSPHTVELLYSRLETLSTEMNAVAELMRYIGGFNERMVMHSKELDGAASIAKQWIQEIKDERDV